ncbi:MAG TPA: ABC-2 family transporter protein, partial [Kofleriaceae bacterium]|nr:ABC-2 family transporter protein [Kofleriaceae bacterium]
SDARVLLVIPALVGAWALTFFVLVTVGALAFFVEKSLAVFDVYLGVFAVLSGYLIPLALLPSWVRVVADAAPFRYMLSFPVELLLGQHDTRSALLHLGYQWAYVGAAVLLAMNVWRAGVRRYEAYGS